MQDWVFCSSIMVVKTPLFQADTCRESGWCWKVQERPLKCWNVVTEHGIWYPSNHPPCSIVIPQVSKESDPVRSWEYKGLTTKTLKITPVLMSTCLVAPVLASDLNFGGTSFGSGHFWGREVGCCCLSSVDCPCEMPRIYDPMIYSPVNIAMENPMKIRHVDVVSYWRSENST